MKKLYQCPICKSHYTEPFEICPNCEDAIREEKMERDALLTAFSVRKKIEEPQRKEKELLAKFIEIASEEMGNNCCNDVPDSFFKGWTKKERCILVKEFHDWNGDPEEYDKDFLHLPDYAIMSFLAQKILKEK